MEIGDESFVNGGLTSGGLFDVSALNISFGEASRSTLGFARIWRPHRQTMCKCITRLASELAMLPMSFFLRDIADLLLYCRFCVVLFEYNVVDYYLLYSYLLSMSLFVTNVVHFTNSVLFFQMISF